MNASHTVLTDALDAAGVYVGMTRGRETNTLHVVATDLDDAKQQFVEALVRDRADRGLEESTERAREAVVGLVANGPMSIVNAERDRVIERIAKADAERERWVSAAADAKVAALLAGAVESLAQEAATDGADFMAAQQAAYTAYRAKANAPRFRKRSATRAAKDVDARREAAERIVHGRWQSIPHSENGLPEWAEAVARRWADHSPEIIEARAEAVQAHQIASETAIRQSRERAALYERVLENRRPDAVAARVKNLHEQAACDRRYLTQLDALPPDEAVRLIHERAAQAEAQRLTSDEARRAAGARAKQIEAPSHERSRGRSPYRDGPSL